MVVTAVLEWRSRTHPGVFGTPVKIHIAIAALMLLALACGGPNTAACPDTQVQGRTCQECGPADECLRSEELCLPKCDDDTQCTAGTCRPGGYCATVCG